MHHPRDDGPCADHRWFCDRSSLQVDDRSRSVPAGSLHLRSWTVIWVSGCGVSATEAVGGPNQRRPVSTKDRYAGKTVDMLSAGREGWTASGLPAGAVLIRDPLLIEVRCADVQRASENPAMAGLTSDQRFIHEPVQSCEYAPMARGMPKRRLPVNRRNLEASKRPANPPVVSCDCHCGSLTPIHRF